MAMFETVAPCLVKDHIFPLFSKRKLPISFFAKKARGLMARYIIEEGLNTPEGLKDFTGEGYYFSAAQSQEGQWVFLRDAPQ